MEIIEDDDLTFSIPEVPPSPIYKPKLKRLKKSSIEEEEIRVSDNPILEKKDDFESDLDPLFSVPVDSLIIESESLDFGKEVTEEEELDPLFSVPDFETEGFEKKDFWEEEVKEKGVRKRLDWDGEENAITGDDLKWKKKKRSKRSSGDKVDENSKSKEVVREKKKSKKERRAELEQLHADSQRLLRETRDASFKPVPVVQKPISSVLEKIRHRKKEVLKQTSILCESDSVSMSDCSMDELFQKNSNMVIKQNDAKANAEDVKVDDIPDAQAVESRNSPKNLRGDVPCNNVSEADPKDPSPTKIVDTEETTKTYQPNGDNSESDNLDDVLKSSLPTSKLNSDPDYLSSDEEEENGNKENISPDPPTTVNIDSSQERGLAKSFLDDEAEEEDDSDHDLLRFQDNEEEENESDADEVLKDLIATNFEEAPVDHDKRNQLHQKWLEQQDAAGTDDILQRLKYGQKQSVPNCLDDEDEDNDGDFGDESENEKSNDLPISDEARNKTKKVKQMIAQMFTDKEDAYVHSDDEEAEQTLLRQRILKQTDESPFISPFEDEHSKEVFGLIKKLNVVPVTKKKGNPVTTSFDSIMMSGNSNSSSKSSFLNKTTSTSLPSSHKQASATVRAYIFGRDDSNSRSAGFSNSENISDKNPEENHPKSSASKVNIRSQTRSTAKTKIEASTSSASNSSLFQILQSSSIHFDKKFSKDKGSNQGITESQVAYQFSSFKLGKRATKIGSRQ